MQCLQCTLQLLIKTDFMTAYEPTRILRWSCPFYWIWILLVLYHWPKRGEHFTLLIIHTWENTIYSYSNWVSIRESEISVSPSQTIIKALHSLNATWTRLFSDCISAWWVKWFNDFILLLSHSLHNKSESMPE